MHRMSQSDTEIEADVKAMIGFAIEHIKKIREEIANDTLIDMHYALAVDAQDTLTCWRFASDITPDTIMEVYMPAMAKKYKWLSLARDSYFCTEEDQPAYLEAGSPMLKDWPKAKRGVFVNVESQLGRIEALIPYDRDGNGKRFLSKKMEISAYGKERGLHWFGNQ